MDHSVVDPSVLRETLFAATVFVGWAVCLALTAVRVLRGI